MRGAAKDFVLTVLLCGDFRAGFVFPVLVVRRRWSLRRFVVCSILFIQMIHRRIMIWGSIMDGRGLRRKLLGMPRSVWLSVGRDWLSETEWILKCHYNCMEVGVYCYRLCGTVATGLEEGWCDLGHRGQIIMYVHFIFLMISFIWRVWFWQEGFALATKRKWMCDYHLAILYDVDFQMCW